MFMKILIIQNGTGQVQKYKSTNMKGWYEENSKILYIFPQTVGEIPYVDPSAEAIAIQQENLDAWKTANSDYASMMVKYNYNMMTVQPKVWSEHTNDDLEAPLVSPELAWSEDSYTATIGSSNPFPTLTNPHSVTVSYSSSDTSAATINISTGDINLVAAGTTTISAIFLGDDTYEAQTVTYTLTVQQGLDYMVMEPVDLHDSSEGYYGGNLTFTETHLGQETIWWGLGNTLAEVTAHIMEQPDIELVTKSMIPVYSSQDDSLTWTFSSGEFSKLEIISSGSGGNAKLYTDSVGSEIEVTLDITLYQKEPVENS